MTQEAHEAYKPVFFSPGWASEKYYGWRCVHEEAEFGSLEKHSECFIKRSLCVKLSMTISFLYW